MTRFVSGLALAVLFLIVVPSAQAQTDGFGLGAAIGVTNDASFPNPVGVSAKGWLSDRQAVAGATSFFIGSEFQQSYWILQTEYLFHNFNRLQVDEGFMALYVGGGGQFTVLEDADNQFALRVPVGADYMLGSAPVDIFVEVAPTLTVTNPTSLRFDGTIGFRYFFSAGENEGATE